MSITKKGASKSRGRPTTYSPKYARLAYKLAFHGANESEIASAFKISRTTLSKWKRDFPDLVDSICSGKKDGLFGVKKSIFKRALGYRYTEVTKESGTIILPDSEIPMPMIIKKTVTKHMAPDVGACTTILKNSKIKEW